MHFQDKRVFIIFPSVVLPHTFLFLRLWVLFWRRKRSEQSCSQLRIWPPCCWHSSQLFSQWFLTLFFSLWLPLSAELRFFSGWLYSIYKDCRISSMNDNSAFRVIFSCLLYFINTNTEFHLPFAHLSIQFLSFFGSCQSQLCCSSPVYFLSGSIAISEFTPFPHE